MGSVIHNDSFITLINTNIAKARICKKRASCPRKNHVCL